MPRKIMTVHHVTLLGDLVDDFELIKSFHHCSHDTDIVREAVKIAAQHIRTTTLKELTVQKKGTQNATST